jgi:hypothetical protein
MALRDQPYFPLYVQDYLTDEKLNCCSAASQGVYIKIMCVLHKQENYGQILFKQKDKQKSSMIENFAYKFAKQLPFDYETILPAIKELVEEGVLQIDGNILSQKRMIKDFKISKQRSDAAKKGGGNPNLFKQNPKQPFKQTIKQNTEYVYENENEVENNNKRCENLNFGALQKDFSNKWSEWIQYKKSQFSEKYKTLQSEQKAIDRLIDISGGDTLNAAKIIDVSIANLWKGLFELDKNNYGKSNSTTKSDPKFGRIPTSSITEYLKRPKLVIDNGKGGN